VFSLLAVYLQMLQRRELNPGGVEFLVHGNEEDFARLEQLLREGEFSTGDPASVPGNYVAAVFTEFPSNPLLSCPDLAR
jgi:cystathionine beta-lyase/cystathionine gamma-synthase